MRRFIVNKTSLQSMVKHTINKSKAVRLFERVIFWKIKNKPLKISYIGSSSVAIKVDIEIKFGENIIETVAKMSKLICDNLVKLAGIHVKSLELNVKDVFNEKTLD